MKINLTWLLWGAAFGLLLIALLPARRPVAQSAGMSTIIKPKKPARRPVARKSVKKPAARRQTRAEFVAEVKAVCARIDAGKERMYSSEEVERELGL